MVSGKRKRKATRQARKQQIPRTSAVRHPDGDRRHRGGMTYEEGLAIKKSLQEAPAEIRDEEE
jgi:hypothetical protein